MRSPVRLFADGLFARRYGEQVDGLWLVVGLQIVAGNIPVDPPVVTTGPRFAEIALPRRASSWSRPTPSVGPLPPLGIATFPPGASYQSGSARGSPSRPHGQRSILQVWWTLECLTRKGTEVRVRSTSPLQAVCAGLLGGRAGQGEKQRQGEPRSKGARGLATEGGRKSMRKVRRRP